MIKIFYLIYVDLLNTLGLNQIIIARKNNVRSENEKKYIFLGIISFLTGYLLYYLLSKFVQYNAILALKTSFLISFIILLFLNFIISGISIFNREDDDLLFSFPIVKKHIIISRIFSVYLKNIIVTLIIVISSLLALKSGFKIDGNFTLVYILYYLFLPLIPIAITNIVYYVLTYYSKTNKKILNLIKIIAIIFIMLLIVLFININYFKSSSHIIDFLFPLSVVFKISLINNNYFYLLFYISICILIIYIYILFIEKKYYILANLLKIVEDKTNNKQYQFDNKKPTRGFIKKELSILFYNKDYFKSSCILNILSTILLLIISVYIYFAKINLLKYKIYLNAYIPFFVSIISNISSCATSSYSIDKENRHLIRTMPIKSNNEMLIKFFVAFMINLFFIIINLLCLTIFLKTKTKIIILSFFFAIIWGSLINITCLFLDSHYNCSNKSTNYILTQRINPYLPLVFNILLVLLIASIPMLKEYYYLPLSIMIICILILIFEIPLYLIHHRKWEKNHYY